MKTRILVCTALSIAVLFSTWMLFFVGLSVELTLGLLGDALDTVHPLHYGLSETNTTHPKWPPSYNEAVSTSSDRSKAPPRLPYHNQELDLFENTYVISLPHRTDRRISMERLRQAVSANWTYVDAVSAADARILRLMECVRSVREGRATSTTEFNTEEFSWPQQLDPTPLLANSAADRSQANSWCPHPDFDIEAAAAEPVHNDPEPVNPSPELRPLTCATSNLTDGPPYMPSLPPYMILTSSKVACWYSHVQVLERFLYEQKTEDPYNANDVALILEDDVDMERDIRERLLYLGDYLPENQWDIIFLGHCWSNESYHPSIATLSVPDSKHRGTTLHPSFAPKCTHAYAVSRSGALRLIQHLRHPPFAYSRALDQAFAWLVLSGRVKSYSVVPSLVVQQKMFVSDIDAGESGVGSVWRDSLDNGILAA